MNLLYIHTHDSGRYLEPYGYPVRTPELLSLAKESILFRNAYCCAPTCSPSRAAMLTGQCAHSSGMLGLAHRGFRLADPERHLSSYLGAMGYETALCGVQHEAAAGECLGYDRILSGAADMGVQRSDAIAWDHANADAVCAFIKGVHEKPFFMSFGMYSTHRPYPKHGDDINPDYMRPAWPIADNAGNREDMADFQESVACADDCVGRVLRALNDAGLRENTVVLFTTDHGIAMPLMKCNLYDAGTGVALMLRYPGNPSAGKVTDRLVSHVDVYPTLCDLLGVPKPDWLQGVSLLPVIERDEAVREAAFSEVTYHAAYEPKRSVRTERYKLIRHYDFHNKVVPANIDSSAPKTFLTDSGYLQNAIPREELYDLAIDPVERVNLIGDARYEPVFERLNELLYRWMRDTDDPLLRYTHRVPKPDGARVNRLDTIDPRSSEWEEPDA